MSPTLPISSAEMASDPAGVWQSWASSRMVDAKKMAPTITATETSDGSRKPEEARRSMKPRVESDARTTAPAHNPIPNRRHFLRTALPSGNADLKNTRPETRDALSGSPEAPVTREAPLAEAGCEGARSEPAGHDCASDGGRAEGWLPRGFRRIEDGARWFRPPDRVMPLAQLARCGPHTASSTAR